MSGALAWQVKKIIKKDLLVFERDRTGFLPGIFSRLVFALLLFLICYFVSCSTHRITTLHGMDS